MDNITLIAFAASANLRVINVFIIIIIIIIINIAMNVLMFRPNCHHKARHHKTVCISIRTDFRLQ